MLLRTKLKQHQDAASVLSEDVTKILDTDLPKWIRRANDANEVYEVHEVDRDNFGTRGRSTIDEDMKGRKDDRQ